MEQVRIVYVGIGGYGATNLEQYLKGALTDCTLAGVVDVAPERSCFLGELRERKIPVYRSMEDFYASDAADLAVISTPLPLHCAQSVLAMRRGSNVLCEKPVASTVKEALEMRRVSRETGRFVNIGYQASYSEATLAFKADVCAGVFGRPLSGKTVCLWPRTEAYYRRSSWAGKLRGPGGEWILDSVASNATAHYLHNLFYVLGGGDDRSAMPDSLEFELYRGNPIESFDTCALRAVCHDVPLLFLASHAVSRKLGPQIEFTFEHGSARVADGSSTLEACLPDGTTRVYGNFQDGMTQKLQRSVDMCLGRATAVCGVNAALPHALTIREFHRDPAWIHTLAAEIRTQEDGDRLHMVPGLGEALLRCYHEEKLPAQRGEAFSLGTVRAVIGGEAAE